MKTATAKRPRTIAGVSSPDGNRAEILAQYEAALRLMQDGKYEKAQHALTDLLSSSPSDLADRVRVYINACAQQAAKNKASFTSEGERYDYAVSLLNDGHYEDARTELQQLISGNQQADFAFYGLAVLASMTGDPQGCLENLTEAIRLNPQNRIQARADSDFQDMADDPRFTELLYPEV